MSPHGIDGLYADASGLLAVQNGAGRERIVRYRLAPAGDRIEGVDVLESRNPLFRIPTTGVVAGMTSSISPIRTSRPWTTTAA